uniref:Ig-like domain-containing protein n=1 Tax=Fundulus heteroclitus TaxID=8078 RepID=A0A3Q2PWU5_FUNHE
MRKKVRRKVKSLLILFYMKHSLRYFLTATDGVPGVPEFIGAATVDEVQMGYCDSNIKTAKPRQDWMRRLTEGDPKHLEWYSQQCFEDQHVFRADIDNLKQRINLTQGNMFYNCPCILQRMNGCEWDDETGEIKVYYQYGFNGEDFLALDLNTLTWIAPKSQAVAIKLLLDKKIAHLQFNQNFYNNECPYWLKDYVHHGRKYFLSAESPSVSLLQKTPSSVVTCHATGFYPDRAEIFWRKDGEEIHEDGAALEKTCGINHRWSTHNVWVQEWIGGKDVGGKCHRCADSLSLHHIPRVMWQSLENGTCNEHHSTSN